MTPELPDLVSIPRSELESLRAELRRLRRQVGRETALERIRSDTNEQDQSITMSREQLAEAWGITG